MSEREFAVAGWALFVVSAFFFMAASWRVGDVLSFLGGLVFLIGCILFLIPLARGSS